MRPVGKRFFLCRIFGLLASIYGIGRLCPSARGANRHLREFTVFCRLIYATQANLSELIPHPDLAGETETVQLLNMSTSPDEWYNLFQVGSEPSVKWSEVKKKEPFKGKLQSTYKDWESQYDLWQQAKTRLESDAEIKKLYPRPPPSKARNQAHQRIARTFQLMKRAETRIAGIQGELEANEVKKIRRLFNKALTNDENSQIPAAGSYDNAARGSACGGNGGASPTGTSLANDITCICAASGESVATLACAATVVGTPTNAPHWNSNAPTLWGVVSSGCPKDTQQKNVSPAVLLSYLDEFNSLIGKGKGNAANNAALYVLGTGSDGNCQGDSATNLCINYKAHFDNANPVPIPWVEKIKEAAAELERLRVASREIAHLATRVRMLRDTAEIDFSEAGGELPGGEDPKEVSNSSPQSPPPASISGQPKVEDPLKVSGACKSTQELILYVVCLLL